MQENEKKSSFFQKWYSESSQNCLYFYHFWEPHCYRFWLKFCFLASNGIGYAFKTSLLSHSFATKQLRVSQVTPIITKQFESENLIQTFQSTSSFWELLAPSKKELFLKCQQAISNPNLELSKLPMAKLCIWFEF